MTGHLPKTHPPRSYGALSEVAGGVPQSEGLAVSKGVRITEVQREGDPEQPPNLTQ